MSSYYSTLEPDLPSGEVDGCASVFLLHTADRDGGSVVEELEFDGIEFECVRVTAVHFEFDTDTGFCSDFDKVFFFWTSAE